jgi:hypothetical protein
MRVYLRYESRVPPKPQKCWNKRRRVSLAVTNAKLLVFALNLYRLCADCLINRYTRVRTQGGKGKSKICPARGAYAL